MTVTFELDDDRAVQLLRAVSGWGIRCWLDGFEEEAEENHALTMDLFEQADGQLGGDE